MTDIKQPKVSIIMPVYNGGKYLKDAISSILGQTYKNFELIIINDGSTDSSQNIIEAFYQTDQRIKIVTHDSNKGIGSSLNEGVSIATGKYIARMDSDDISLPSRLEAQVEYLENNIKCTALFTRVSLINETGKTIENWQPDIDNTTPEEIRNFMPIENCCAHPTLMIKALTMKRFGYDERQVPSEDYDLWLRLLSSDKEIHKLDEQLLLYRMHDNSISQSSNRASSPQKKYLKSKRNFLIKQLLHGQFGRLELEVFKSGLLLLVSMAFKKLVFEIENYAPEPIRSLIIRLGYRFKKMFSTSLQLSQHIKAHSHILLNRLKLFFMLRKYAKNENSKTVLVIVPWIRVGGAEKVLLDIITGLGTKGYSVYCISTIQIDNVWASLYAEHCVELINLGAIALDENKAWFITHYTKKLEIKKILTTNNIAGYEAAKKIKKHNHNVYIADILHGQGGKEEGGGWPHISYAYDEYIDKRVTVTKYLKKYLIQKYGIQSEKICVIHNGIREIKSNLPPPAPEINNKKKRFTVLWAGRFSYEKHPELVIKTAAMLINSNIQGVNFVIVGEGELRGHLNKLIMEAGLNEIVTLSEHAYSDPRSYMCYSDVLLLTSEMEGLPMVILEAFINRLPVISTKVGGIPEIVVDNENGYLIKSGEKFPIIASEKIVNLLNHAKTVKVLGNKGYEEVISNFSFDKMIDKYASILEQGN